MKKKIFGDARHFTAWTRSSLSGRLVNLPDIRNAGLVLKIIIIVVGLVMAVALFQADSPESWAALSLRYVSKLMPILLTVLLLLMLLRHYFPRLSSRKVEFFSYISTIVIGNFYFGSNFLGEVAIKANTPLWFFHLKISLLTASLVSVVFTFLYFVAFALGPASTEAKLQSLTYRIRPHFLFNSLNAILSLIRRDTRKAEYALEELAELFRWLLKDTAQYVTLRKEVDIVQQFITIERVRLGDRLKIEWDIDPKAQEAVIPALTLQPLVENAIYHGAESMNSDCPITVRIFQEMGMVCILVENPFDPNYKRRKGSGIALDTIKQRLELCFDLEFKVTTKIEDNIHRIQLMFPFRDEMRLNSKSAAF